MDFPKSVPSIGLVGGKFVDENPLLGTPGSLIPCQWGNAVTEELLAVIVSAGLVPDEADNTQLRTAIRAIIQGAQSAVLADTGVAGAYAAVNPWPLSALPATGYPQRVKIAHVNPGASTYAPDGLAAKPIYGLGLQPLQGGELALGVAVLVYLVQAGVNAGNGAWILMSSQGGALPVAPATKSQHAVNLGQLFGGLKGLQRFTASGSFMVPDGVYTIYVSGAAGGAGGGGSGGVSGAPTYSAGGGGGGGDAGQSVVRLAIAVTPGQTLTIVIGAGGNGGAAAAAGANGGNGTAGGATTLTGIGVSVTLAGGLGGGGGLGIVGLNYAAGYGGAAGGPSAADGDIGLVVSAYGYSYGGAGGSGGSSPFGSGGGRSAQGTATAAIGKSAGGNGAGGGGARGPVAGATAAGATGGAGSPGILFMEW